MPRIPLNWPRQGATNVQPYVETPGDAAPVEGLRNVRPRRTGTGRAQLATRPGLVATFGTTLGGSVQAVDTIARSSGISGYETGPGSIIRSGTNYAADKMRGQFCVLDTDWSVRAVFNDSRGTGFTTPPTDAGGHGGFSACFHPTNPDICFGLTIARDTAVTTSVIFGINRFSLATNSVTHQTYGLDTDTAYAAGAYPVPGTNDLYPNQVVCNGTYLFVAVKNYVYVFRADNLRYLKRHAIDWAEEVQAVKPVTVGTTDYLAVLIEGTGAVGGPVIADPGPSRTTRFGWFYRSGVALHTIAYADSAKNPVGDAATALTRIAMPMGLQNTDPGYEDHRYFRPSEWGVQRPRGCLVYDLDIAVGSSGQLYAYIARTNQGFGYDGSSGQRPDGTVAYVSACRAVLTRATEADAPTYMSPSAPVRYGFALDQGGWEVDTDSLRKALSWHGASYYNDIPQNQVDLGKHDPHWPGEAPSLFAVAADQSRDRVFFAGRRPSPSQPLPNVYCLRASDGTRMWATDLLGLIQQNAAAVDPTTGNVVVGGNRNSSWTGASGASAEMWELDRLTGAVVRHLDFTDAVTLNGYIDGSSVIPAAYDLAINSRGQALVALAPYRYDP